MAILETPDDAAIQACASTAGCASRPNGSPERPVRLLCASSATSSSTRAATSPCASGTATTPARPACSRRSTRNAGRIPTWTCSSAPSTSGAGTTMPWDRPGDAGARDRAHPLEQPAGPRHDPGAERHAGVLTSRYDIYQDLMDPNREGQLRSTHPDWTQNAWPQDIMLDAKGDWRKGWGVRGKDGKMYHCGVICDKRALEYAAERMPAELDGPPVPLPLHRHDHRRALAGVLPPRPSDDAHREPALEDGASAVHVRECARHRLRDGP